MRPTVNCCMVVSSCRSFRRCFGDPLSPVICCSSYPTIPCTYPKFRVCLFLSLACGAWSGRRYECKKCTHDNKGRSEDERTTQTFNAWDPGVLARMNDFVSKEFPFVLTKKAAISKSIVDRLADNLLEGKGFAAVSKSLAKAYNARYFSQMRSYVSLAKRGLAKLRGMVGLNADCGVVPKFSGIADPSGYNSSPPSAHYLGDIWSKWFYETPVVQVCTSRTRKRAFFVATTSNSDSFYRIENSTPLHRLPVLCVKIDLCAAFFPSPLDHEHTQDDGCSWTREEYLQLRAQLIDGRLLAGDASFKYARSSA